MRLRKMLPIPVVAVLGASASLLPAVAGSETSPTISAENYSGGHRWTPAAATVAENGVVTFANPTEVPHGIEWVGGPATPACAAGVPVGDSAAASGTKWSGACTFAKAGTYTFYCTVHGPEMTGTVTVAANGTTTTTMTMGSTETTSTTHTTGAPGYPGEGGSSGAPTQPGSAAPLSASLSAAVKLAASQHGRSVHGAVNVSKAQAGARLEVQLLATRASLAGAAPGAAHGARVQVGRLVRSSLTAGAVDFSVALDARARHALGVHRRLALVVEIVLTPAHGSAVRAQRNVVVHG